MREVDGGTFLNEPNIGRIAEALRCIFNEGVAKECGAILTGATIVRKDIGEVVSPLAPEARESARARQLRLELVGPAHEKSRPK